MARYVYKGKVNGNDVVYKEGCFHGPFDNPPGTTGQNIMEVVTETGKEFRFRAWTDYYSIIGILAEKEEYMPDYLNEVVIKDKGKKKSYNIADADPTTVEGMRTKLVFEKARRLYDEIRQEILKELKEEYAKKQQKEEPKEPNPKKKNKRLEELLLSKSMEDQIREEVGELFGLNTKIDLCLYRDNAKKCIELFSKIGDKSQKKELLNAIFKCEYENKEVIDWLNRNEQDLLREAGFNS